jgi:hypothetical protein
LTPAPTDLALIQHLQDELSKERQKRDEIKAQLEKVKVERDALAAQLDAIKGKVSSSVLLASCVLLAYHISARCLYIAEICFTHPNTFDSFLSS